MKAAEFAIAGVLAAWLAIGLAMVAGRRRTHRARVRRRRRSGLIGIVLQGVGFGLALGWPRPRLGTTAAAWGVGVVSVLLAWSATALVWWAGRTLGRQWSLLPRVVDRHALIEQGPYAVVRHPISSGMLGLLLASGLARGPSWAIFAAAAAYSAGTILRIRLEEALLDGVFGVAHRRYARRVPAFVPLPRWVFPSTWLGHPRHTLRRRSVQGAPPGRH
jgi:protein-S-isoprenylcysteine O-methyltransferase Ste14